MIKKKSSLTTVLIPLPRAWLGLVVLVIMIGLFLTSPFLLWSYHIERAGRLLDQGLIWPEARQSDSLPQLGNPDALKAAEEYLAAAIRWRPTDPYAYRLTAQSYIAQGEWERAVKIYEQAEKLAPKHPLLTWEKALVYEQLWQEGTNSAHPALLEAWAELNLDATAFQARAQAASSRGKPEVSLRWYARALQLSANLESAVAYGRYLLLEKQGDESAARARLEEAISYDTGWLSAIERFQAWSRWARLLFDGKQYSQAEAALQQAIAVFPEDSQLEDIFSEHYRLLGLTQLEQTKPEAALESFQKAFEINHQNIWAYVSYGQLLYELEPTKMTQSTQAFETALLLASDDLQLWETLILYWRRAQEMEQVEVLCQLAITEQRATEVAELCQIGALGSSDLYYQYLALLAQDKQSDASAALEQAISLDEGWFSSLDRFRAWSQWGRLLFDKNRYTEAEEALQFALSESPEQIDNSLLSQSYRYLALTQIKLAKPEAALENLAQAIELDDQNLWAYVDYGQLLYQLQPTQATQATESFKKALLLEPDNVQLWQDLIRFWRREQEIEQANTLCEAAEGTKIVTEVAELCQVGAQGSSDFYYQSQALSEEGQLEQATEALEQAISLDEGWFSQADRFRAWSQWGRLLFDNKRYPEAEAALQLALSESSEQIDNSLLSQSYRYLALTQIKLAKPEAALENLAQAIELDNQNLWAYVDYGQLLYQLQPTQATQATESFKKALLLEPDNVQLWQDLIRFWRREQEIEQAHVLCEAAEGTKIVTEVAELCQIGTEASSDFYYQSQALSEAGKIEQATEALQQAITLDEGWFSSLDRFQAWGEWGRRLFDEKRYIEAEEALQFALSESSEQIDNSLLSGSYRYLALTQIELGKPEAAVLNLEQAIELDNQNLWAYVDYGQLLYQLQPTQATQATESFQTALLLAPDDVQLWQQLILYWRREQEIEQANVLCEAAEGTKIVTEVAELCQIGTEASSDFYYQYLALLAQNKESDAYTTLERAILLDQGWFTPVDRFQAWFQWGRWLQQQKEYAQAERVLKQAVSYYPEEAGVEHLLSETYRFMGMSQARQGKQREAFESFELSKQWDEKNVWSLLNYGQLLYQLEPQRISETDDVFAQVLTLKENDPNVWRNVIGFWLNQNEEERATMLCQQVADKEFAEELKDLCK